MDKRWDDDPADALPRTLGPAGGMSCPGTTIAILPMPNQCLGLDIHCRCLPPCPFASLPQLDSPQPPARPDRAPLLVFFGDSARSARRGMSRSWLLEGRERFEMMCRWRTVCCRVAPSPPDPTAPRPPVARPAPGRGSGEAGTLCDWMRRGCSMSGRTVAGWWGSRAVMASGACGRRQGGQISAVTFLILTARNKLFYCIHYVLSGERKTSRTKRRARSLILLRAV